MPGIVARPPFPLSGRAASAMTLAYVRGSSA